MDVEKHKRNSIPINAEDIRQFNFEEIISKPANAVSKTLRDHTCSIYERHFMNEYRATINSEDETRKHICQLFGMLCSFTLNLDSLETYHSKSIIDIRKPSALTPSCLELLLEIVNDIQDPELQARVGDILWVLKRNHEAAWIAIYAYLNSAIRLEDPEHYLESAERIERALQIATQQHRNGPHYKKVIKHIEDLIQKLNGEDPLLFSHKLMSLLIKHKQISPIYISLTEKLAKSSESNKKWHLAREYWLLLAKWKHLDQKPDEAKQAKRMAANAYVNLADIYIEQLDYYYAINELRHAIDILRQISAEKSDIDLIHAKLLQCQRLIEFHKVSYEIDTGDLINNTKDIFKNKDIRNSILILASLIVSPQYSALKEEAIDNLKNPINLIFSRQYVSEDGRVTAKKHNIAFDKEIFDQEEVIHPEMYAIAKQKQDFRAYIIILPAIRQINQEHRVRYEDLIEFVSNNPFIPKDREEIFIRGLYYGFHNDFLLAIHLLMPQIENSIRYLLKQHGIITSLLNADGIQDERDLGYILNNIQEVEDIFGQDLLFDLKGLLIDRLGSNLRNLFAHGLLNSGEVISYRVVYLWGLILRLCCYASLVRADAGNKD